MIEKLFNDLEWKYKTFEGGYLVSCPNKSGHKNGDLRPSCGVWPAINYFKCWGCGHRGPIEVLFEDTDIEVPEFLDLGEFEEKINPILDDSILHFRSANFADLKTPSFKHRNLNKNCIKDLDLRYDEDNNNLVFPVRSPELVGAVGRYALGKGVHNYFGFSTGKTLGGYNRLTDNPKLAIVEGWTCLANCYRWADDLGYDVVCTFTANVTKKQCQMLADTGKTLHFWYDQDPAGKKGVRSAEQNIDDLIFFAEWSPQLGDIGSMDHATFLSIFEET